MMPKLRPATYLLVLLSLLSAMMPSGPPEEILLWPNGAPGSEGKDGAEKVRVTDQGEHVISNIHHRRPWIWFPEDEQRPRSRMARTVHGVAA